MRKTIFSFALLIIAVWLLFKISKYSISNADASIEWIVGIVAIIFFSVGVMLHKKSLQNRTRDTEEAIDYNKIKALQISDREYDVLQGISEGLSNKEIGEKLFVSESTVKSHVSSLLTKLNAKRRTQALQIAKAQNII
jgi:DNA-binding NarL/FixJ family response regulator